MCAHVTEPEVGQCVYKEGLDAWIACLSFSIESYTMLQGAGKWKRAQLTGQGSGSPWLWAFSVLLRTLVYLSATYDFSSGHQMPLLNSKATRHKHSVARRKKHSGT